MTDLRLDRIKRRIRAIEVILGEMYVSVEGYYGSPKRSYERFKRHQAAGLYAEYRALEAALEDGDAAE